MLDVRDDRDDGAISKFSSVSGSTTVFVVTALAMVGEGGSPSGLPKRVVYGGDDKEVLMRSGGRF